MKIELQAVAPNARKSDRMVFDSDRGSIIAIYAREGSTTAEREALARDAAATLAPDDCLFVLPHGSRLDVVRVVEASEDYGRL